MLSFLGNILDSQLKFDKHVKKISKKVKIFKKRDFYACGDF